MMFRWAVTVLFLCGFCLCLGCGSREKDKDPNPSLPYSTDPPPKRTGPAKPK
jgi:hypothetical protein